MVAALVPVVTQAVTRAAPAAAKAAPGLLSRFGAFLKQGVSTALGHAAKIEDSIRKTGVGKWLIKHPVQGGMILGSTLTTGTSALASRFLDPSPKAQARQTTAPQQF